MHQFDLKNKTAIITGGAQGFGLDIAKRFVKSGAKVIIWDIDEKELQNAVKKINNPKLAYNIIDVSNFEKVNNTVIEINKSSNIDILINNAGITGSTESLWNYDVLEWNKIVNKDLFSANETGTYYFSGGWHLKALYSLFIAFIFSAATIWNPDFRYLQSYSWLIGAFASFITYYLLANR